MPSNICIQSYEESGSNSDDGVIFRETAAPVYLSRGQLPESASKKGAGISTEVLSDAQAAKEAGDPVESPAGNVRRDPACRVSGGAAVSGLWPSRWRLGKRLSSSIDIG
jgi:hypothetical protein